MPGIEYQFGNCWIDEGLIDSGIVFEDILGLVSATVNED